MFSQVENTMIIDSTMTEQFLEKKNLGTVGYHSYYGQFYDLKLSNSFNLQTGLFRTNSDNFVIVELPILIKHDFGNNFRAFFGSKMQMVVDPGFSTLQPLSTGSKSFSASTELGFQYDFSHKMMIELRYSLPIIEQSILYPSIPSFGTGGQLFLGTDFKF